MRTGEPKLSVLMPVYNGDAWLIPAIKSIQSQSLSDFELIVIDDGSTDQSGPIVEDATRGDDRIRRVQQQHLGISAALNRGMALARAPIIARMDADDVAEPDRLRVQLEFLGAHPRIAAVGSWAHVINDRGDKTSELRPAIEPMRLHEILRKQNPFIHSSMAMRAGAPRDIGGYRSVLDGAEDYDLWLRMSERAELANVPAFLLSYRSRRVHAAAARRQLLAARLARLSAKARRMSAADFVDSLAAPLAVPALRQLDDLKATAALYELLARPASDRLSVEDFQSFAQVDLDHAERRTVQLWLKDLLASPQSLPVRSAALFWLLRLHPARALSLIGSGLRGR